MEAETASKTQHYTEK